MREVQSVAGPAAGLSLLLAALGLGGAVGPVGVTAGALTGAAVVGLFAVGLGRSGATSVGPPNAVTLARALLTSGVVALTVEELAGGTGARATLTAFAAVALLLDGLDGWVARRTGSATALGARFDMEVDALLILALSVTAAHDLGWWVLLLGAARYLLWAATGFVGWLRAPSPPRRWAKTVAATVGVCLTVAVSGLLPDAVSRLALAGCLALLAESFGRQVWWLRRHRSTAPAGALPAAAAGATALALTLVWVVLSVPARATQLVPEALLRIPVEALVAVGVALVLPGRGARAWAWVTGVLLGVVVFLKAANLGFTAVLDRPFDPLNDRFYVGPAIGVLEDSVGTTRAVVWLLLGLAGTLAVLVLLPLGLARVQRVARGHRAVAGAAILVLGLGWSAARAADVRLDPRVPVASTSSADLAVDQVGHLRADLRDRERFAAEIRDDRFAGAPDDALLAGLRGHDVLLVFVESYGRVALTDPELSPGVEAVLDDGTEELASAGYDMRSAYFTSPTFGAASWLAHSTLQSGLWVDSQQRYNQLLLEPRVTLSDAFRRAGWRTVFDLPAVTEAWPQGEGFYHYDRLYDASDVGYRGPAFSYATMPDQYTLSAFRRLELTEGPRPRVMAEIDLVSSHHPWTPLPQLVPEDQVGDGSIFDGMPEAGPTPEEVFADPERVRRQYAASLVYSWESLVSFLREDADPDLVVVVLGDHQPHSYVTGPDPGHDVPVSVIARDPGVIRRIEAWDWDPGLRPTPDAPVWRMDRFRDAFFDAFE
ncbi:CDP-alcohol phosphatidyltransferase family protein [Nocardioides sp.]|uniref:CDP-alcohol phosphatidyltransferase family protein n=1 Tax=Nocardioides sp. TaxID=35761 RepID=UPI0035279CC1